MGTRFEFICNACNYAASVSGGYDVGMDIKTKTMVCVDCCEVVDVYMGPVDPEFLKNEKYLKGIKTCPKCGGMSLKPWTNFRRCPKCGSKMKKGDMIILWD